MQRRRRWRVDGSGDDVGEDCSAVGLTLAPDRRSCITWCCITAKLLLLTTPKKVGAPILGLLRTNFCDSPPPPTTSTHYPPGEQSSEPTGELSSEPYENQLIAHHDLDMADTS